MYDIPKLKAADNERSIPKIRFWLSNPLVKSDIKNAPITTPAIANKSYLWILTPILRKSPANITTTIGFML